MLVQSHQDWLFHMKTPTSFCQKKTINSQKFLLEHLIDPHQNDDNHSDSIKQPSSWFPSTWTCSTSTCGIWAKSLEQATTQEKRSCYLRHKFGADRESSACFSRSCSRSDHLPIPCQRLSSRPQSHDIGKSESANTEKNGFERQQKESTWSPIHNASPSQAIAFTMRNWWELWL